MDFDRVGCLCRCAGLRGLPEVVPPNEQCEYIRHRHELFPGTFTSTPAPKDAKFPTQRSPSTPPQLGAFFGAIAAFVLGDKLGRKRTIAIGHSLNLAGAVLQFTSWRLPQLVLGRVVNGVGMGMTSTISPVYLAECARSHLRGRLLVVGASSNVSCFCLANWISYAMYFQDRGAGGAMQWRFPLAFQLVFAAVLPLLTCVPESPRWLLLVDRDEEALRVIAQISGGGTGGGSSSSGESSESDENEGGRQQPSEEDPLVVAEYRSIKTAIRLERESRVPLIDVLCHRDQTQNFRRLLLACGTQFMQQFSGINALGQFALYLHCPLFLFCGNAQHNATFTKPLAIDSVI